jgi:Tricorn protease C1 domain
MLLVFLALLWVGPWPAGNSHDSVPSKSLNGLWLSDGYGLLLETDSSTLRTFEVTSISCLPGWSATRRPSSSGETGILFVRKQDTLSISVGPDSDTARMHVDGTSSDVLLHRTTERPKSCRLTAENVPPENYAIFWQTFAEHYPFFKLRHVDWHALGKQFQPQLTAATTSNELFGIFCQMLGLLQDAHTGLVARDIQKDFAGWRPDPNHLTEDVWKKASEIIEHSRRLLRCAGALAAEWMAFPPAQ